MPAWLRRCASFAATGDQTLPSPPFQGGVPTKEAGRVPTSDAGTAMTAGSLNGVTTVDATSVETLPASSFVGGTPP